MTATITYTDGLTHPTRNYYRTQPVGVRPEVGVAVGDSLGAGPGLGVVLLLGVGLCIGVAVGVCVDVGPAVAVVVVVGVGLSVGVVDVIGAGV
jgi:hypothetical protein